MLCSSQFNVLNIFIYKVRLLWSMGAILASGLSDATYNLNHWAIMAVNRKLIKCQTRKTDILVTYIKCWYRGHYILQIIVCCVSADTCWLPSVSRGGWLRRRQHRRLLNHAPLWTEVWLIKPSMYLNIATRSIQHPDVFSSTAAASYGTLLWRQTRRLSRGIGLHSGVACWHRVHRQMTWFRDDLLLAVAADHRRRMWLTACQRSLSSVGILLLNGALARQRVAAIILHRWNIGQAGYYSLLEDFQWCRRLIMLTLRGRHQRTLLTEWCGLKWWR